jgi:2-C-methyl-D-erythritol 4-phosphate cytidylyltransferase
LKFASVLVAAGIGTRFAGLGERPKQFLRLRGLPIYLWSLSRLAIHERIEKVVLVLAKDQELVVQDEILRTLPQPMLQKVALVAGGSTRQESVNFGLESLFSDAPEFVLVHDAARPFLSDDLIDPILEKVIGCGACSLAVPVSDTVKRAKNNVFIETIDRGDLFLIQTPQAARYEWLLNAHRIAISKGLSTTDDAGILESAGYRVELVIGSPANLKITKPADLALCEALTTICQPALTALL